MEEEKYNLLTQKLLKMGYTKEYHPDYVRINSSAYGEELWQNLSSGFEYEPSYLAQLVFETGCGLCIQGSHFITGQLSYRQIDWIPENNNPVITCPYRCRECKKRNPLLINDTGSVSDIIFCDCHQTTKGYDYYHSVDYVLDQKSKEKQRLFEQFCQQHHNHVCHWHMRFNEQMKSWKIQYDPMTCAMNCQNIGGVCSLTEKPVTSKRGNVFYDVYIEYERKDGTLFDGEIVRSAKKGVRLFDTNKSLSICESVAEHCKSEIKQKVYDRYHSEIFILHWNVSVQNIRAEAREGRDLIKDLEDIKNGISISYDSDIRTAEKMMKKKRRSAADGKKKEKLMHILIDPARGYESLKEFSVEYVHANKWFSKEELESFENQRQRMIREAKNQPIQLSLFS
ncbi:MULTISPECIES: hypothetical protein [Clostridia]|uniref:hypothetical protein n=1 Tax=Clostridia TaxID=186801 RepID=UPI000E4B0AF2|nr:MULTISPECIES: hypothetical protein [Clostridia]RHV70212.1 hypothetical protein DXB15_07890 [Roseburia sp. OM02-15]